MLLRTPDFLEALEGVDSALATSEIPAILVYWVTHDSLLLDEVHLDPASLLAIVSCPCLTANYPLDSCMPRHSYLTKSPTSPQDISYVIC